MMNEDFEFSGDMNQLKASAEAGDAEAQFKLGYCYETDQSPWRDWMQVFRWYRKAAQQGHAEAQFKLGVLYEKGRGVKRDRDQSVYWHRKAAEQDHAQAQFNLGYYYENYENRWNAKRAQEEAFYWYRKAAEQGHAQAQFKLGYWYERGIGVQQDWVQASGWYSRAAEQDHTDAQNKLSECYYNGTGVPQDARQAVYWYHRAAKLGDAQDKLNECRGESMPEKKNKREKDESIGPFTVVFKIVTFALGAAPPFIMPEAIGLTPVCQFIIAYLYVFAVVIEAAHKRISNRSKSVVLWLYFLSWAAATVFGFLFVNGTSEIAVNGVSGIWMIFCPIMFWEVISGVNYFKNHWRDW